MCLVVSTSPAIFCSNLLQMLLHGLQLPFGTTRLAPLKAGKTCSSVRFSTSSSHHRRRWTWISSCLTPRLIQSGRTLSPSRPQLNAHPGKSVDAVAVKDTIPRMESPPVREVPTLASAILKRIMAVFRSGFTSSGLCKKTSDQSVKGSRRRCQTEPVNSPLHLHYTSSSLIECWVRMSNPKTC